jgi:hypothetical protein
MKNRNFILITTALLLYCCLAFSQSYKWSSVIRVTNSRSSDRHPALPQRLGYWGTTDYSIPPYLAFDRVDSQGTNICAIKYESNKWSSEIQYLTKSKSISEYPDMTSGIIVFHSRDEKKSNIYYCTYENNKWSEPKSLTNDTNKFNLFPRLSPVNPFKPGLAVVWEKDKKIYFKKYDGNMWLDEKQITPNDTFKYTRPAISNYSGSYTVAFQRTLSDQRQDIFYSYGDNDTFYMDTIIMDGYNRNPRFITGFGGYLAWERKINNRWVIYKNENLSKSNKEIYNEILLNDSINNYNNFNGLFLDMPAKLFKNSSNPTDINGIYILNCVYNFNKDSITNIVLKDPVSSLIIPQTRTNNPALSHYYLNGGHLSWAIWENEENGFNNLYGSSYFIVPTSIQDIQEQRKFSLFPNYPNPFNPSTTISYELSQSSKITIYIYDVLGRIVSKLADEYKPAGRYSVTWDAKNVPSGIYYYRITAGNFSKTSNMMLIK